MGVYAPETNDVFAANGTALGVVQIASNALYRVGATAWIRADAQPNRECVIMALIGSNSVALQFKSFQNGIFAEGLPDAKEEAVYGRADLTAYTTVANARIFQEAGIAPNPL